MTKTIRRRGNRPCFRVEALEARALLASAGTPDPTFGSGTGYASFPLGIPSLISTGSTQDVFQASAITLPNGNIVVSGIISTSSATSPTFVLSIAEFNPDGSIDTGFGIGGQEQLPVVSSYATLALPSGQFLVAEGLGPNDPTYAVVRINANGAIDTSFGQGGVAQYPIDSTTPVADRLQGVSSTLLLSGGQILLVDGLTAVRLDADGSLDATFGQGGTVNVPVTVNGFTSEAGPGFAATQANGQILLAGTVVTGQMYDGMLATEYTEGAVVRLNANGSLDTTYGGPTVPGVALIPFNVSDPTALTETRVVGFAIDPTTGQSILSALTDQDPAPYTLYKLNTNGTFDTSFGTGGEVTTLGAGPVIVQTNSQIVVADNVGNYPYLFRFNADGTPDATFGNGPAPGVYQLKTPTFGTIGSLTIQPNGDLMVSTVGSVPSLSGRVFALNVLQVLPAATAGPSALPIQTLPADFTGQGYTDPAVYDPTTGSFLYTTPTSLPGFDPNTIQFGIAGTGQTIPAAADYLGNGRTEFAAYLPASGVYAILPTNGSTGFGQLGALGSPGLFLQFGMPGAGNSIPVPADYYGTGQADVAVYMPSSGSFAILAPGNATGKIVQFGIPGAGQSIPAPADYYGTGQADLAVYLAQSGTFAILSPGGTSGMIVPFGKPGLGQSIPVPGDYDGSGHIELAVYVPSAGAYFYRPYNGGPDVQIPIGLPNAGYIPVPGDYDGSGRTEAAIYDPTTGVILYKPANGSGAFGFVIGTANNGSIPVAAPAGALPEFSAPGSGSGSNAIRSGSVPLVRSGSVSTAAITLSSAQAVPAGPTLASVRVARTLINQAAPDPFERL